MEKRREECAGAPAVSVLIEWPASPSSSSPPPSYAPSSITAPVTCPDFDGGADVGDDEWCVVPGFRLPTGRYAHGWEMLRGAYVDSNTGVHMAAGPAGPHLNLGPLTRLLVTMRGAVES
nr:hypothetical protein CFP56_07825 [Quercus suber]